MLLQTGAGIAGSLGGPGLAHQPVREEEDTLIEEGYQVRTPAQPCNLLRSDPRVCPLFGSNSTPNRRVCQDEAATFFGVVQDVIDNLGSSVERMSIDREASAATPTAAAMANGRAAHAAAHLRREQDLARSSSIR